MAAKSATRAAGSTELHSSPQRERLRQKALTVSAALRAIGKARDKKLWTDAYSPDKGGSAAKQPPAVVRPQTWRFNAQLPIRVTADAAALIGKLKSDGVVHVRFPPDLAAGGKVIGVGPGRKESLLGVLHFDSPEIVTDIESVATEPFGIVVRVNPATPSVLEFVVRAPLLPKAVRSLAILDEGGLGRRFADAVGAKTQPTGGRP